MKKQAILRGLLGFPLGVAMGQFITVAASAASGYGTYSAVMPEFAAELGSELGAVALQMLLCGLMGAAFGAASVIWQLERWSIAAQSAAYFAVGGAASHSMQRFPAQQPRKSGEAGRTPALTPSAGYRARAAPSSSSAVTVPTASTMSCPPSRRAE